MEVGGRASMLSALWTGYSRRIKAERKKTAVAAHGTF